MKTTPMTGYKIHCSKNAPNNSNIFKPNSTLFGTLSDQPFTAYNVWERFFTEVAHPQKMQRFIEFGCDQGGTAVFFALWCANLNAEYIGYDKRNPQTYRDSPVKRLIKLRKKMRLGNGYKKAEEIKGEIQKDGMSVIFADCVDKPWEFITFAPMLKQGDVLAMHDWDRAIKDEWVADVADSIQPFELLFEEERIKLSTLTKFFRKL